MLEVDMLIKTNYSGPYRVKRITRDCVCQNKRPHIHLECTDPDGKGGLYWLHGWDERTLRSLDKTYCGFKDEPDFDKIFIIQEDDETYQGRFDFAKAVSSLTPVAGDVAIREQSVGVSDTRPAPEP